MNSIEWLMNSQKITPKAAQVVQNLQSKNTRIFVIIIALTRTYTNYHPNKLTSICRSSSHNSVLFISLKIQI